MMWLIDVFAWVVSAGLLLVAALLGLQVLASLLPMRKRTPPVAGAEVPSFVVVMPAHNEENIIESTVRSLLGHLGSTGRLLVVADNCSDATAERARAAGASVIERTDSTRRGKGYALAHGVDSLCAQPPQVVLILDADCRLVQQGTLQQLAVAAHNLQRPIQGSYDMLAPEGSGLKQRLAAFAWAFKSRVRAEGYRRLGLPCHLMGSGMAFPWPLLQRVNLATGHIVEDLKLGLDFAQAGAPPMYLPWVGVESDFPSNEQGAKTQRQRWEHGHLSILTSDIPRYVSHALRRGNGALLAMCLDVCIPPLSFFGLILLGNAMVSSALMGALHTSRAAWTLAVASVVVFGLAALIGWWKVGRRWVSVGDLLMIPIYIFAKIPIYLGFFLRKNVSWIRTRRD